MLASCALLTEHWILNIQYNFRLSCDKSREMTDIIAFTYLIELEAYKFHITYCLKTVFTVVITLYRYDIDRINDCNGLVAGRTLLTFMWILALEEGNLLE